jgi:hypothetical protein
MNLIFTSHSIDLQLIFTYFSLHVADFSVCAAFIPLFVPLMFSPSAVLCFFELFLMHLDTFSVPKQQKEREKNTNIYSVCHFYHPVKRWSVYGFSGGAHGRLHRAIVEDKKNERKIDEKSASIKNKLRNQLI